MSPLQFFLCFLVLAVVIGLGNLWLQWWPWWVCLLPLGAYVLVLVGALAFVGLMMRNH